jgi:hypothetical protein
MSVLQLPPSIHLAIRVDRKDVATIPYRDCGSRSVLEIVVEITVEIELVEVALAGTYLIQVLLVNLNLCSA